MGGECITQLGILLPRNGERLPFRASAHAFVVDAFHELSIQVVETGDDVLNRQSVINRREPQRELIQGRVLPRTSGRSRRRPRFETHVAHVA